MKLHALYDHIPAPSGDHQHQDTPSSHGESLDKSQEELEELRRRLTQLESRFTRHQKELKLVVAELRSKSQQQSTSANALTAAVAPPEKTRDYPGLVARIRAAVEDRTPNGAIVAVVSKGDPDLVRLTGRTGWHFPQERTGTYAGFYPSDGGAAVALLEEVRSRGAQFLVIPETASWWLQHYREFRERLENTYSCCLQSDRTCRVYDIRGKSQASEAPKNSEVPSEYADLIRQTRDLVERLLPTDAKLAVLTRGDPAMLSFGPRKAFHFPSTSNGQYLGHHPASGSEALSHLQVAIQRGAGFLVVPKTSFWWLSHYQEFAEHLRGKCRIVTQQAQVCAIFEL